MVVKTGQQIKDDDPAFFRYMVDTVRYLSMSPEWTENEPVSVMMVVTEKNGRKWEKDIPIVGVEVEAKKLRGPRRAY